MLARENNITWCNPTWVQHQQRDLFIKEVVDSMKVLGIKYQMIDIGFFDKNPISAKFTDTENKAITGRIPPESYPYLKGWISMCRQYDSSMKLIGSVSGSLYLHVMCEEYSDVDRLHYPSVTKPTMHKNIAKACKDLILDYGLDGINLDFEPLLRNTPNVDLIELVKTVRNEIGKDKHLSLCALPFESYLSDADIVEYAKYIDMLVLMDYNTGRELGETRSKFEYTTEIYTYISLILDNLLRIGKCLPSTCDLIPLAPGKYKYNTVHRGYENSKVHSHIVNLAISKGVDIAGSGVWWFDGTMRDSIEFNWFIKYWVKGAKTSL